MGGDGRERFGWIAPPLLALFAGLVESSAPQAPDSRAPETDFAERRKTLREATERCDWDAVVPAAEAILAAAPRGSDAWLDAGLARATAFYKRWNPEAFEAAATQVISAAFERRTSDPRSTPRDPAPLPAGLGADVIQMRILLAELLQAHGRHEDAVAEFQLILQDLRKSPPAAAHLLTAAAGLDLARSQMALGRPDDARISLTTLRDGFSAVSEGARASVLLQKLEGIDAYRGKYAGDPGHRRRMEEVQAAVPRARALLAARMGRGVDEIPAAVVGVADRPAEIESLAAVTTYDRRRTDLPAVTVLFSEGLAFGTLDPEWALVHEFAHVVMTEEIGVRHEWLPEWLIEGIPQFLSGELRLLPDVLLELRLLEDPEGFSSPGFWSRHPLVLAAPDCRVETGPEEGLALLYLLEKPEPGGWKRLLKELVAGRSVDEALRASSGLGTADYLTAAHAHAMEVLESRRQESIPAITELIRARALGPREAIEASEKALAAGSPHLARGFARMVRAQGLEGSGRREEALAVWREIVVASRARVAYAEIGRMAVARQLLLLGREEEAALELEELKRGTFEPSAIRWADSILGQMKEKPKSR